MQRDERVREWFNSMDLVMFLCGGEGESRKGKGGDYLVVMYIYIWIWGFDHVFLRRG